MLIFFLCSCNSKNGNSDVIIDVDDEFRLTFLEDLSTPQNDLLFRLESIDNKGCESDTVLLELNNFGNALSMNVNVRSAQAPCDVGQTKAFTQNTTGILDRTNYPLSIRLQELLSNPGDLLIDEKSYQLSMETTYGFYLPYDQLQKIPKGMLWGYVAYTPLFEDRAVEFVEEILALSAPQDLAPGQYGYFEMNADQELLIPEAEAENILTIPFYRSFDVANSRSLQNLIDSYQNSNSGMRFVMWDSYGKVY